MSVTIDNSPKRPITKIEKFTPKSKIVDNFNVKKCPLMDNFDTMTPSIWSSLNGSSIIPERKDTSINANILTYTNESMCVLSTSTDELPSNTRNPKGVLPYIYGITPTDTKAINIKSEESDSESNEPDNHDSQPEYAPMVLPTSTKIYVGALSVVGLFILFRVVNRTK